MKSARQQLGLTLLEAMLVIAILAAGILMGTRIFLVFRSDMDAQVLKDKVNQLFIAMGDYYQSNCRELKQFNSDGTSTVLKPGELDPTHDPVPATNFLVDIQSILINRGYLKKWQPFNIWVDNASTKAYVLQFNRKDSTMNVTACVEGGGTTTGLACTKNSSPESVAGTIVVTWVAQVAVKIKDTTKIPMLKKLLGATCISDLSGSIVTPCESSPPSNGGYLVWQQRPTESIVVKTEINDIYWKQLNMLYSNDGMAAKNGTFWNNSQYYLCGGS